MSKARVDLVLASASPRRQAFLRDLGFTFAVAVAEVDESPLPGEKPIPLAVRLAEAKAKAAAGKHGEGGLPRVIVAADTVVALGDELYGKPVDEADAAGMLMRLRNREHQVHSAVCVLAMPSRESLTRVSTTTVRMRDYSDEEIAVYVATGDPMDKAGAYAIQHPEFAPAASIEGCLTGVMGLPLGELCRLLAGHGALPATPVVEVCEGRTHFRCCQREVMAEGARSGAPAEEVGDRLRG